MSHLRTRWSAIGAAVAVTLGAGGIGLVSATTPADAVAFVPITPCRVADTRPEFNTGPRDTPLGPDSIHTIAAHGDNGDCVGIPATATGLSLNVTALGATSPTFLTVWAEDATQPTASSLNPVPGQPPTPNAVTTGISAAGEFNIYNLAGTVDVIVDINGYYTDHGHDDRYYTKAQIDEQITGFTRTVVVNASDDRAANGAALVAAVAEVNAQHPSAAGPWAIFLEPGDFELTTALYIPDFVAVTGSGIGATRITSPAGDPGDPVLLDFGVGELRDLTVSGTDQFTLARSNDELRVENVRFISDGGQPVLLRLTGGTHSIVDSEFIISASTNAVAVSPTNAAVTIRGTTMNALSGTSVELVYMDGGTVEIENSRLEGFAIGIFSCCTNAGGSVHVRNSSIDVTRTSMAANTVALTATVENSTIATAATSVFSSSSVGTSFTSRNSVLRGGTVTAPTESCYGTTTAASFLTNTCP
ncbi:MAG: hypothetical protein R8G01_07465 [Ilumatobacteraceae bacterium]|nr:hypothetical protein [Ilumatobacteraceae bacterium]